MAIQSLATPKVLVYTATAGYRHDSIPTAIEVLGQQQAAWNVSFTFSECVGLLQSIVRSANTDGYGL
jgi:hypothetical protein